MNGESSGFGKVSKALTTGKISYKEMINSQKLAAFVPPVDEEGKMKEEKEKKEGIAS